MTSGQMRARAAIGLGTWALAAALLLVGGFLVLHAMWCGQAIRAYNNLGGTSSVGAFGRPIPAPLNRSVFLDGDSYAWVDYATRVGRGETFRVRRNEQDNYPFGREVHWGSGYVWILAAAGWVRKLVVGGDIGRNIEQAAVLVNPLLFFLLLTSAAVLTARSFGSRAAVILVLAAGGAHELYFAFYPGRPDHHGLIVATAWGTVFSLIGGGGGWVRADGEGMVAGGDGTPDWDRARRWFIASAVLGGVGFWVSAMTQSLVTALVCAGALAGSPFIADGARSGGLRYRPELWRLWGRVGAATSVFFYLLEYFPNHLAFRLEVNHPLYALAWWGCGELIARFLAWRAGFAQALRGRELTITVLAVAAVAAIPLVILLDGPRFYLPLDTLWVRMLRMVLEQQSPVPAELLREVGMLAAACLLSALVFAFRRPGKEIRFSFALVATCSLLTFGLALGMRRWIGLFEAMLVLQVTVCARHYTDCSTQGVGRRAPELLIIALLLVQFGFFGYRELTAADALRTARTNYFNLMEFSWLRSVAEAIRAETSSGRAVVLSDPGTCEVLGYFGDFNGITSQYWENLEGLRAAADIYVAKTDSEALELIRRRGITHIVLIRSYEPSKRFFELKYGRYDAREAFGTFGSKMHVKVLPAWIRAVPLVATAREFRGLDAEVFKVAAAPPAAPVQPP